MKKVSRHELVESTREKAYQNYANMIKEGNDPA